jgi:transposase
MLEVKREAVRLVESGQSIASALRTLRLVVQTLFNWVRAQPDGTLKGADSRSQVTAEQMEISRLQSDLARVTMERDISGKAMAYFAKGQAIEAVSMPAMRPPGCFANEASSLR